MYQEQKKSDSKPSYWILPVANRTDDHQAELVDITPLIPADYEAERSRILSPAELLELHNRFQQMTLDYSALPAGQKYEGIRPLKKETQLALWISLGTLCRIGELLQAEWKNIDLDQQTWFLPSENVKGTRGKKQDHHVFLSPFALHFFQELKILTGDSQWCFPNKQDDGHVDVKVVSKQVGDRQARFKNRKALSRRRHDDTLVLADGQNGDWTPHDLRRTGATMMQALGVSLDIIDRCQNHVLAGSRVRRHYLHHDYAEEKKCAWNLLGDRLSAVLSSTYDHQPTESMMSFQRTPPLDHYHFHKPASLVLSSHRFVDYVHAATQHFIKQPAKEIAVAKTAVWIFKTSNDWVFHLQGSTGRTSDTPYSMGLRTIAALSECRSNSPRPACRSSVQDQSTDGRPI